LTTPASSRPAPTPASSIGVFCGARTGRDPAWASATRELAHALAQRNHTIVYGGGNVGLMGVLADSALERNVRVVGVIPESMVRVELAHTRLAELHVVPDMLERKKLIMQLSDAFIALPGGVGTLDEVFEVVTWTQLSLHANRPKKPCVLLNIRGFYDPLVAWLERAHAEGLVMDETMRLLPSVTSAEHALEQISQLIV
jgi:uncharacterized protein (TIGR00730 family)